MAGIQVRVDPEMQRAIDDYAQSIKATQSQAVRLLLTTALAKNQEQAKLQFSRQAFREGLIAGQRALREKIGRAVQAALSEFEEG